MKKIDRYSSPNQVSALGTISLANEIIPEVLHTKTETTPTRHIQVDINLPLVYSPKQVSVKNIKSSKANVRGK